MLSRPIASFLAHYGGWRTVFTVSGATMIALAAVLPSPAQFSGPGRTDYRKILGSLGPLFAKTPELRRRGAYQAALFGAFSLFWTAVPLLLSGPAFGLTQRGIGLFALAGAAGAFVAPIAGRLGDRGYIRAGTVAAMLIVLVAFGLVQSAAMPMRCRFSFWALRCSMPASRLISFSAKESLRPCRRSPRAPQRTLHRDVLRRRRAGIGACKFRLCLRRLVCHMLTGAGFALFALCAFATEFTSLRRMVWLKPSISR